MNKLAITLALTTTTFSTFAFAFDKYPVKDPAPTTVSEGKPEIIDDPAVLDTLWKSEEGQKLQQYIKLDEPIIDEMDPGARCDDISANKTFNVPVYSKEIAGFGLTFGLGGGIGIVADATSMGAQASFGPTLRVFGQDTKPLELKLSATTKSTGQNSVDLHVLAFGYELDSYNIANSTSALEYSNSVNWSLPNAVMGTYEDSYECNWLPFLDECTVSWGTTPLVANLAGIFVLRVNSQGAQAHALAAATAYSNVHANAIVARGDYRIIGAGGGVMNFMRGRFWASGKLIPHNSHWLAAAEADVNIEDVLGGKASVRVELEDFEAAAIDHTIFKVAPMSFSDLWNYSCTFDKKWK
ncbi:MAG: hypothetical protein H0T46_02180 [Deltaproteobacteria bacterium]|nr:hypothetical protein [Deltaproteobacteria bacterium]